ncbi:hypothetical protein KKF34_18310 [Myxococcota bacterium]|nr:hypothetical protein [Myxococcota bacterium]MBU1383007.1 hypothetical protein [Myxococcota bacterium]MBU1498838.1 hypothetical protein [Myxococcota bacterium]
MIWLALAFIFGSAVELDDPKLAELAVLKSETNQITHHFPSIQISWTRGSPFKISEPVTEDIFSLIAFPLSFSLRFGLYTELGIMKQYSGGHFVIGLAAGFQKKAPLHFYADFVLSGGAYIIDVYGSSNIFPVVKTGVRTGLGTGYGRLNISAGIFVDQIILFMEGQKTSTFAGLEIRIGI